MLAMTFADLRFRSRQFLICTFGVGVILALALALSGLAAGFRAEVNGTVGGVGATSWVLSKSANGRVSAFAVFPELEALVVQNEPGADKAAPLLLLPVQVAHVGGVVTTVNVMGVLPGRLGDPTVDAGHGLRGDSDVVVDNRIKSSVGDTIVLGGHDFHVVGTIANRSLVGGIPMVYMALGSAQRLATDGQPLITAVVTSGTPRRLPHGLVSFSVAQVEQSTVGQLGAAAQSVDNTRWLMWAVAVIIVGSSLYVSALERRRDFAVLKALGSSSFMLFGSLLLEALVVTLVATVFAEFVSNVMSGLFSQPVDITSSARATLPIAAVLVGMVASFSALRRVTSADPAGAFG